MRFAMAYRVASVVSYLEEIFGPSGLRVDVVDEAEVPDVDVQTIHPRWAQGHIDLASTLDWALPRFGASHVLVVRVTGQPEACDGVFLDGREPAYVLMAGEMPPGLEGLGLR